MKTYLDYLKAKYKLKKIAAQYLIKALNNNHPVNNMDLMHMATEVLKKR